MTTRASAKTDPSRLVEIRDLAAAVSERHWVGSRVDPAGVLRCHGVQVCYGDFEDAFDGLLEWRSSRFYAYCNDRKQLESRTRFTLAHEAGHYFIDEHRNALIYGTGARHGSRCDFRSDDPMEREADYFAAHLLMPSERLHKAARKVPSGLAGVIRLATQFGTSVTATALRYIDEILGSGVVVFWDTNGFRWRRVAEDWWFDGRRKTISSVDELVPGCATRRLLSGEAPEADGVVRGATTASYWFPKIGLASASNEILHEEAVPLGEYGFLTLLYPD